MSVGNNTYLVEGCGEPSESGKDMGNALYVVIEASTMGVELRDCVTMSLTRAQWELIMACLSLQCDVS